MRYHLGSHADAAARAADAARARDTAGRLWRRDHTLWQPDPAEVADRLGWLDCPAAPPQLAAELTEFAAEVGAEGTRRAVLLGMGGSSLAPEVLRRTFGVAEGLPDLAVLDSTHPATVRERLADADPATTLFVVSTKSGGTVETLSLFLHCWRRAVAALGERDAGRRFCAITDPGSGLERMAEELGFRRIFRNDPEIGGRYSALSLFGLVPAALVGADPARLLASARGMAERCRRDDDNPAVGLGTALAALAQAGRDKLTLLLPDRFAGFGDWVEQLVAESLGKRGRGILPVVGEPEAAPAAYGADRVFAVFGGAGDADALAAAGHPVIELDLGEPYDLGAQFFLWEAATAVAGAALGINPFDQPDVESAKVRAREMVAAYRERGALPAPPPTARAGQVAIWAPFAADGPADAVAQLLALGAPGDYLAIHAYLPPGPAVDTALGALRRAARARTGLATTVGYGPRFLHSTGQLHKGDRGKGLFLQLTADAGAAVPIPDGPHTDAAALDFGTLIAAQALGDRQALLDAGRRVLRLHLGADPVARLGELTEALGD